MLSGKYRFSLAPQKLQDSKHSWLLEEAKRSDDFCYTRVDRSQLVDDEVRSFIAQGKFGGRFLMARDELIANLISHDIPGSEEQEGRNKILDHLSMRPRNLICNTVAQFFADKKSDVRIAIPKESIEGKYSQDINIFKDKASDQIYQKISFVNVPLVDSDGKAIGYIKGRTEFLYQLTDAGFKLIDAGTESELIHDVFQGVAPIGQLSQYDKYRNEIIWTHKKLDQESKEDDSQALLIFPDPSEAKSDIDKVLKAGKDNKISFVTRMLNSNKIKLGQRFKLPLLVEGIYPENDINTDDYAQFVMDRNQKNVSCDFFMRQSYPDLYKALRPCLDELYQLAWEALVDTNDDEKFNPDLIKFIREDTLQNILQDCGKVALRAGLLHAIMQNFEYPRQSKYPGYCSIITAIINQQGLAIDECSKTLTLLRNRVHALNDESLSFYSDCENFFESMLKNPASYDCIPHFTAWLKQAMEYLNNQDYDQFIKMSKQTPEQLLFFLRQVEACKSRLDIINDCPAAKDIYLEYEKIFIIIKELGDMDKIGVLLGRLENIVQQMNKGNITKLVPEAARDACDLSLDLLDDANKSTPFLFMRDHGVNAHVEAKNELAKPNIDIKQIRNVTQATIAAREVINNPFDSRSISKLGQAADALPGNGKLYKLFGNICFVAMVACFIAMPFTGGLSLLGLGGVALFGIAAATSFVIGGGYHYASRRKGLSQSFFKVKLQAKEGEVPLQDVTQDYSALNTP